MNKDVSLEKYAGLKNDFTPPIIPNRQGHNNQQPITILQAPNIGNINNYNNYNINQIFLND